MSLYDGISVETAPVPEMTPKSESDTKSLSGWSSGLKLMASQLQRNKKALRANQQPKARQVPSTAVLESAKPAAPPHELPDVKDLLGDDLAIEIQDEYDPLTPNSYEKITQERRDKQDKIREEDRQRRREERQKERERERDRDRDHRRRRRRSGSSGSDSDEERAKRNRRKDTAAIPPPASVAVPPPSSLASQPEQKQESEEKSGTVVQSALQELSKKKAPRKANPFAKPKFGSFASKIMSKYGWEEGKGLGKASQGISTALSVEKTSKRGGKIVNMAAEQELQLEQEKKKAQSLIDVMKNPSKVVLLQNMVGPGDVDEDLEPEVGEECAKYGEVHKCLIFEIPHGVPEEEAVRIFVEFTRVESAIKAVVDLNGRFFGGRTVKAGFYSKEKFSNLDLAP